MASHGLLSEFHLWPIRLIDKHKLLAHKRSGGLQLYAHLQLGMDLARNGYLVGGDSVWRVGRPIVYKPQVGVGSTGSGCYSIAVTSMYGKRFVWVVVAAVVDKHLQSLGGVRYVDTRLDTRDWLGRTHVASYVHVVYRLSICPDHSVRSKMRLHAWWLPCEDDGAILWRGCEKGPGHGGRVAHDLGAFDKVLKRLGGLQTRQGGEAVQRG